MSKVLDASSRIAFAGLIHDIGKFYERSKLSSVTDEEKQLCCPKTDWGWSHVHAAYTSKAIDELTSFFPTIRGDELYPFKETFNKDVDDSIINSASWHHNPRTLLQKIITTADRLSSAFERDDYESYAKQKDNDNYITARLCSVFEELDKECSEIKQEDLRYSYPLKQLSAKACFPEVRKNLKEQEAENEYAQLWTAFKNALKTIPQQSYKSWAQWLDHFDTLWLTYTQAIPSASAFSTRNNTYGTIADVSLYDHSKTTAALATALWRYYEGKGYSDAEIERMLYSDEEEPFLVVQGDMSGIQDFIFSQGSETQTDAAKILRGRSFFISLLSECASLKILEALDLPATSQIINAAGHFMIIAHNTKEAVEKLQLVKKEIEDWFYKNLYAVSHISLAWKSASKRDFTATQFPEFQKELQKNLERAKLSQMNLCNGTYSPVFSDFLEYCSDVCEADGRFPADNDGLCSLCSDIKDIGEDLTKKQYILIGKRVENPFKTRIFGYEVQLSEEVSSLTLDTYSRVWDIALPTEEEETIFRGYARRNISAYIPKKSDGKICSFEDIVKSAEGKRSLMTLKGDIDNLGYLFQKRIQRTTFASYAGLSRRINTFFAVVVPVLCSQKYKDIYTVFAGGDDFFFIAPWDKQIEFLSEIKSKFDEYVCHKVTFSAGMVMAHEKTPIRILAEMTETELEKAKALENKNGVCCFNQAVPFNEFSALLKEASDLDLNREKYDLSTGFVYRLISLCEKAQSALTKPEDAIWRSWLAYRVARHLEDKEKSSELSSVLGRGIEKYLEKYKIPLFIHLYKLRGEEHV